MGPATELSTTERYLYDKGSKGRCLSIQTFVTRWPFCPRRLKKLCLCMASLVLSTRLAVHKQSFSNLLRQNGRRMTKVYLRSGCIPSLNISQLDSFNTTQCCKNKTLKLNYNFVQSFRKFSLMFSLMRNSILSQQLFVEFCLRIKKD